MHNTAWNTLHDEIITCHRCPRLRQHCTTVAQQKVRRYRDEDYWGLPVPGFGDRQARLLIVGLAPGAHGANRTGRLFTGDDSGSWLYSALYEYGFADRPTSTHRDDGLTLRDAYITNVVRCAPPENKPTSHEANNCRPFLLRELALLKEVKVVLALGRIAFTGYVRALREAGLNPGRPEFKHGAVHRLADRSLPTLLCSYHPSRQNTNTGRLTRRMWHDVFATARQLLG